MKYKLWMLVPALAGAVLLGACSDGPAVPATPREDPLVERLVEMGMRRERVVDGGDHFVVEGDIRVEKKDLRGAAPSGAPAARTPGAPRFQRYLSRVAESRRVIRVSLSNAQSESPSWANAARAAMSNWNQVANSYVVFEEGSPSDVAVLFVSSLTPACSAAQSGFPAAGAPGSTVAINRTHAGAYTYAKQVWIMTHELGHVIGLLHNDDTAGTLVPGTPASDAASVMNGSATYPGCPGAAPDWSSFSGHDQAALRWLYPIPAPPGLAVTHPAGTVRLGWTAVQGATAYQVRRVEVYREEDLERGSTTDRYEGSWANASGTSFDTGAAWTGTSSCEWMNTAYTSAWTEWSYEVRTVHPNGTGTLVAAVPSQDAAC